jgi:hypothetical protein
MRPAQGWAGVWRRAAWINNCVARFLARSASKFSSPETPDNYRYRNPRRELLETVLKTPLQQPTRETNEQNQLQTPAPASTLSSPRPSLSPGLLQQRAGVKGNFANSVL